MQRVLKLFKKSLLTYCRLVLRSNQLERLSDLDRMATVSKPAPPWLKIVQEQIESLRFGEVQIIVHDSKVVQIQRTEKVRLEKPSREAEVTS